MPPARAVRAKYLCMQPAPHQSDVVWPGRRTGCGGVVACRGGARCVPSRVRCVPRAATLPVVPLGDGAASRNRRAQACGRC